MAQVFRFHDDHYDLKWIAAATYEDALMQAMFRGWQPFHDPRERFVESSAALIATRHLAVDVWFLPDE